MERVTGITRTRGVTHQADAPLLQVEHVSAVYTAARRDGTLGFGNRSQTREKDRFALRDVTFQVDSGESVAVVGPNGAGKSTLFKIIAGTLRPKAGFVGVYGHGPDQHICIAYVPQRSQIDWSFPATVEEVVMMGRVGQIGLFRRPQRPDWDIVHNSLERVNATHLASRQIGELSGGQQQRVFIARALAQRAELLLLDEPFSGLDVPSHEALFAILERLRQDGVTVMVATHDLNLAAKHFDRVMLLNKSIIALGPPAAVLDSRNLVRAYGGQMHLVEGEDALVLPETGCGHDEGEPS
jgi:ABC-type Mn2+/Zn2+ transport system ATPase subunit